MLELGDLHRPAKLYVVDEERRTWKTLWLTKKVRQRLIFTGFIRNASYSRDSNGPASFSVEMEDATSLLERLPYATYFPDDSRTSEKGAA